MITAVVNIGRKLSCQIIPVYQHSHYLDNETNKRMKLEVVNEDNINEAINRLKINQAMVMMRSLTN